MRGFLRTRWRGLVHSLWFFPGLVVGAFVALAFGLVELDRAVDVESRFVFGGQADAARDLLAVLAGSLITIAGVTFSVTVVVLQLVSSQFSPRVLRTFLGDPLTQLTAGTFIGVFVYCLLVLEEVRNETDAGPAFVPTLAVTVAIFLGLLALGFFLAFIHHMAQAIQVSNLTQDIGRHTLRAIDDVHPLPRGERQENTTALLAEWEATATPRLVPSGRPGYVQSIAHAELAEEFELPGSKIHLCVRPGDFVTPETTLARVWSEETEERVRSAFRHGINITSERDIGQDAAFGFRQLADIAIKAQSPSINDPTTATTAIGYMCAAAVRLAGRETPARVAILDGVAEIVADARTFGEYVESFVEVGRHAVEDPRVTAALLEALREVAEGSDRERRRIVAAAAAAIAEPALAAARTARDRDRLAELHERVQAAAGSDGDEERRVRDRAEEEGAEAARALLR